MENRKASALIFNGKDKPIEKNSFPLPVKLSDYEVLVSISLSTVCGSDVHTWLGHRSFPTPSVMGHEMVGVIEDIGSKVTTDYLGNKLTKGDRIIWSMTVGCGNCFFCHSGLSNLCPDGTLLGRDQNGGFGEFVAAPLANVYPLPESVSDQEAPLIQVLTTCLHAQRRANIVAGEAVVVMGLGVSGLLHLQLAKQYGADPVICVTRSEWKRDLANKLGADATFESGAAALTGIQERTEGRGADLVIECVGQLPVLAEAFELVRFGGRIMPFGIYTDREGALPFYQFYFKEISIINARAAKGEDYPASIDLVSKGAVRLEPMVTHVKPLSELAHALTMLKDSTVRRMKIIIDHDS